MDSCANQFCSSSATGTRSKLTSNGIMDAGSRKSVRVPDMRSGWYPQVVGIDAARRETDKLAGRLARLFVHGKSVWEIVFFRPGERAE